MPVSTKYSYFVLRFGLAFWAGWWAIYLFRNPLLWADSVRQLALPGWLLNLHLIYLLAIFSGLLGFSLILQIFHRLFSLLAVLVLIAMLLTSGFSSSTINYLGLIGALFAIVLWPTKPERY